MNDAVLVRSTERRWDTVLTILAGVVMLVFALAAFIGLFQIVGVILLITALGLIVGGAIRHAHRVRSRRWLRDTGDGFVLLDRHGERHGRDADVLSMALVYQRHYSSGLLQEITREFVIWLASDQAMPEELKLTTTYAADQPDPLSGLIERIASRLYEQSKADLAARRPVLGKGWRLENGTLTARGLAEEAVCPLAEIVALDRVDNQLCVWRQGEEKAGIQLPLDTANVPILARILDEEVAKRPANPAPPPEGSLGRVIFERKTSNQEIMTWMVFTFLCLAGSLALIGFGMRDPLFLKLGLAGLAITGLVGLGWYYFRRATFRCHEFGVFQATLLGERTIRYADVEAFTFSATRMFHNGVYTGTLFTMLFEPSPGRDAKGIHYTKRLPHADDELENLRHHIGKVIASRMAERFHAGETVAWTPHLRIRPDGLEHEPAGFFGRKATVFIPFDAISNFDTQEGQFYLWTHAGTNPVISEAVSERNFFPGFYLFLMVNHQRQEGQAPATAEA